MNTTKKIKRPISILLVEDNEGDIRLIQEAMKEAGFKNITTVAKDGSEAMNILRNSKNIDLVILDLNLPGKNGRDVLKDIKTDNNLKHIPVIVLSSSSAEEDIVNCYNMYANCYITKPLEIAEYQDVMKKIETFWLNLARLPKNKINLLVIEDNQGDARLVEELLLKSGHVDFDIDTVENFNDGTEEMLKRNFDLVLLDLNLPDSKGMETFQRFHAKFPAVPVILFTGISDEDIGIEAIRTGAQSYILKQDLSPAYLERTIRFSIERNRLRLAAEDLLNIIVHELRTPMAIIKEGSLQLIEGIHGQLSDKQKEFVKMVFENSEKMEGLITELLEMARINIGTMRLDIASFDLGKEFKKTCDAMAGIFKKKKLSLGLNIQEGNFFIDADKKRIGRVLSNLLANALKFTEKGKVEVALSDLQDKILCSVADTGTGMSPSETQQVFAKYQQSFAFAKSRVKGIGLGLYICKSIIDAHSGVIYAESTPGKGSKFTFILPKKQG
ncbi:MAG: hypothetical protein COV46_08435 [Deltaproteobacteria bacterium CG11_big_fil_rev_8_21_14_0_20_49_13]|nr:MAG: hypothetical protein COV46_08435 [Deltaproteobacteria bacterium CG11_big_fil_rev_8_21_14_0_20_49_13]